MCGGCECVCLSFCLSDPMGDENLRTEYSRKVMKKRYTPQDGGGT